MTTRYRSEVRTDARARQAAMAEDIRQGLSMRPLRLPPKYFYDEAGSRLFDEITRLPEYYLTRTEEALLAEVAPGLMHALDPRDVVELGSGFSTKTRRLLGARAADRPLRYTPVDVDGTAVAAAADHLLADDPRLEVHAVIGDFEHHLDHVPPPAGRRLVLFLGSTIGNLDAPARQALLGRVRRLLRPGDGFLLGVDHVKDRAVLEAAYNDAAGVTAAFNRNILRVVNRGLGADFRADAYRHHAWYNSAESRIEMHLAPESPQVVTVSSLDLTLRLEPSETIWTESSYKFTRVSARSMLSAAGLRLEEWYTDREQRFALALAAPARPAASATRAA
jgi:L-histidine N-alpha-methyltransferase